MAYGGARKLWRARRAASAAAGGGVMVAGIEQHQKPAKARWRNGSGDIDVSISSGDSNNVAASVADGDERENGGSAYIEE